MSTRNRGSLVVLNPSELTNVRFRRSVIGKRGYRRDDVDAFLRRIARMIQEQARHAADATEPVTPVDVHHVAFRPGSLLHRGYDEADVDAFLDEVEEQLTMLCEGAISPTLRPMDVMDAAFARPPFGRRGYSADEVDALRDRIVATLRGDDELTPAQIRAATFAKPRHGEAGYDERDVDRFLELAEVAIARRDGSSAPLHKAS